MLGYFNKVWRAAVARFKMVVVPESAPLKNSGSTFLNLNDFQHKICERREN